MVLIPNVTLVKLLTEPIPNPTIEPFTHKAKEVYRYLGKIPSKDGQPETYRNQFIRVMRLRDKHEFVMFKKHFSELTAKTPKKRYDA